MGHPIANQTFIGCLSRIRCLGVGGGSPRSLCQSTAPWLHRLREDGGPTGRFLWIVSLLGDRSAVQLKKGKNWKVDFEFGHYDSLTLRLSEPWFSHLYNGHNNFFFPPASEGLSLVHLSWCVWKYFINSEYSMKRGYARRVNLKPNSSKREWGRLSLGPRQHLIVNSYKAFTMHQALFF